MSIGKGKTIEGMRKDDQGVRDRVQKKGKYIHEKRSTIQGSLELFPSLQGTLQKLLVRIYF